VFPEWSTRSSQKKNAGKPSLQSVMSKLKETPRNYGIDNAVGLDKKGEIHDSNWVTKKCGEKQVASTQKTGEVLKLEAVNTKRMVCIVKPSLIGRQICQGPPCQIREIRSYLRC